VELFSGHSVFPSPLRNRGF